MADFTNDMRFDTSLGAGITEHGDGWYAIALAPDPRQTVELELYEEDGVTICTCGSWPLEASGPCNVAHSDDCALVLEEY